MLTASASVIADVVRGDLVAGNADVVGSGVAVDSRAVEPGAIFVALDGEHADGHDYCASAAESGAHVLVVSRPMAEIPDPQNLIAERGVAVIAVQEGRSALKRLAAWHRDHLNAQVIGITGSTGKTTTKDFLAAVLETSMRTVATRGNRNNEIGLPLTITSASADTEALVVEMGMRGIGQIAELCAIARPTLGVITNVGTSHIEILGSQDAVAAAKGELIEALPAAGAAFLNGDDAYTDVLAAASAAPIVRYGTCARCDVRAQDVELDANGRAHFELVTSAGSASVVLPIPGRHNVYNALAAAAVGVHLGIQPQIIAIGLSGAMTSGMRMESFTTASGITVINDAYNANPASMKAGVETLAALQAAGKRVAVLGDMAELGSLTELAHFGIGEAVVANGVDTLVTVGERARRIADGALSAGLSRESVRTCESAEEATEVLDDLLVPGDVVLVKASRVMGLERVVEGIVNPRAL